MATIGSNAFSGCSGLVSIQVDEDNTAYDSRENCNAIIEKKANALIAGCKTTTIPNTVASIGKGAFSYSGITAATIPQSVTSIGDYAFEGCSELVGVNIPQSVTSIGDYAFEGCSELVGVNIPESVISIGVGAFKGCSSLTSITIPANVSEISNATFCDCSSLTVVSISKSIKEIGYKAFQGCNNIIDFYSYSEIVPNNTNPSAFYDSGSYSAPNIIQNAILHVPETSINAYKNTIPWSSFGTIVATKPIHKLTYIVDGEVYKSFDLEEEMAIKAEKELKKEGYTFSGWSEIPSTMPDKDVSVTGSFTINKYKLIYKVDDEIHKTYEIEYGETITAEAEPTKEGYTFSGWSEIPASMPAHDVTVKGSFTKYTLTYMVDGDVYKTFDLEKGTEITPETLPTKEGYTFSGWSEIPATMPEKNVTVTGSFTINKYTLTYEVDGEIYKTFEVEYGTYISAEEKPKKKGFTFSGWSEIPSAMPAHDVIINGSYTPIIPVPSYKRHLSSQTTGVSSIVIGSFVQKSVGFNLSNEGTESINVSKLVVKNPENNYSIVSTSTDASLLGQLDGGNSIALSVNLNADFTPCYEWHYTYKGKDFVFCSDANDPAAKHDVTFYVDDQIYVTYEYDFGEDIIPEAEPAKDGYTFSGWSEIPETMPKKDVSVKGSFTLINAIEDVIAEDGTYEIYTLDGKQVEALQKGVNIIKFKNGSTQKIYVK